MILVNFSLIQMTPQWQYYTSNLQNYHIKMPFRDLAFRTNGKGHSVQDLACETIQYLELLWGGLFSKLAVKGQSRPYNALSCSACPPSKLLRPRLGPTVNPNNDGLGYFHRHLWDESDSFRVGGENELLTSLLSRHPSHMYFLRNPLFLEFSTRPNVDMPRISKVIYNRNKATPPNT